MKQYALISSFSLAKIFIANFGNDQKSITLESYYSSVWIISFGNDLVIFHRNTDGLGALQKLTKLFLQFIKFLIFPQSAKNVRKVWRKMAQNCLLLRRRLMTRKCLSDNEHYCSPRRFFSSGATPWNCFPLFSHSLSHSIT